MHLIKWGRWSSGKTQDFGSRGPGLESHQDHRIFLSKNIIPAPLIIDPDVLLVLLHSPSVLMSFSHQVVSAYYLVRLFYVIKLVLKIVICRHRKLFKSLRQVNFDAENYFDNS